MPSRVYKGDLTEVTFGHESGIDLPHDYASSFLFRAKTGTRDLDKDTSIITFSGGAGIVVSGVLKAPIGMLVGAKIAFTNLQNTNFLTTDDYMKSGRTFTIIKHAVVSGATELTITPALKTDHSGGNKDSVAGEFMRILPFSTPSIDTSMAYNASALTSKERSLTDQFVGLVSTVTLPETKVDLKRYHVVGLGRDVAVQVPGRFLNLDGSFECNIHNSRWLYYCLGNEVTSVSSSTKNTGGASFVSSAIEVGDSSFTYSGGSGAPTVDSVVIAAGDYVVIADTNTTDVKIHRETASDGTWPAQGASNIISKATKQEVRRIVHIQDSGSGSGRIWLDDPVNFAHANSTSIKFARFESDSSNGSPHFTASTGNIVNPVERLIFSRTTVPSFAMEVSVRRTDADSDEGTFDGGVSDSKQLTRVFRGCKVKNFSMVADTDAALRLSVDFDSTLVYTDTGRLEGAQATASLTALSKTAGQANTRVLTLSDGTNTVNFSIDNSLTTSTATKIAFGNANSNANQFATNIAAAVNAANTANTLDMSASASNATVTLTQNNKNTAGNTTPSGTAISDSVITLAAAFSGGKDNGDRYDTHRLFEDTANTEVKRKESGIEKRTQKPFMFYNGTIQVAGVQLGQVVSFTLNGSTGVQQYYTINGAHIADDETAQVPFAGTRNASLAVEGKTEYDLEMEIIVDDPVFYHRMRRGIDNFDEDTSDTTDADMIRLSFIKQGTGATRESLDMVIDDYYIVEAPLPIPEDKGPLRSVMKIMPKSMHVIAKDTLLHN